MTTVLAVYNSDGCVGRCDAHCHNAKHPECTCICGGMNHGKGREQAMENTREATGLKQEDLELFASLHTPPLDPAVLHVVDRVATPNNRKARKQARLILQARDQGTRGLPLFEARRA